MPSIPKNAAALLALLTTLAAASLVTSSADASPSTAARDAAFDRSIRQELETIDPGAVPFLEDADRARNAGDFDGAARGYEEVRKRAPAFFHATRRLCGVEMMRDNRDRAVQLCREAVKIKATPENHASLAAALVSTKNPPQSIVSEADHYARRAAHERPDDIDVQSVVCRVALQKKDANALATCSDAMIRIDAKEPFGHLYASISAGNAGDFDRAEAELETAKSLGLPTPIYDDLKKSLTEAKPTAPVLAKYAGFTFGSWLALFGALFVLGSLLSASALSAARKVPSSRDGHAHGIDALLRRAYRVVLWLACGFYYVSLPLLAVLLLASGAGLVYVFLMIGRIPIKLLLIVGVVILSSLWAILKSIFVRIKDEDPGERIDLAEHPRMRAVLDEVAARVGTRPVDHVYLTPGTDVAVLERGGIAKQLRGDTERALVLGAGVLDGLRLRAFKGILAHEYGHFRNEDTAGGGFALAVRRSILKMAIGLAENGAASNINPAWWFVRGFHSVFLRISQGASRLQEVLADRAAAFAYGSAAFEAGMRHVVYRSLAFDAHADHTLNEVIETKAALANLYRYTPAKAAAEDDIAKAFDEAWNAEPSPYDSHPRPADRIEWVRALATEGAAPASSDDEDDAWSLFGDRAKVEEHMTSVVRANIASAHGIDLRPA